MVAMPDEVIKMFDNPDCDKQKVLTWVSTVTEEGDPHLAPAKLVPGAVADAAGPWGDEHVQQVIPGHDKQSQAGGQAKPGDVRDRTACRAQLFLKGRVARL